MLLHHEFDALQSNISPLAMERHRDSSIPFVELLLDHRANIRFKNNKGRTILHYLDHAGNAVLDMVDRII